MGKRIRHQKVTAREGDSHEETMELLDSILSRPNMQRAYQRVMRNKGAAGVDGMSVDTLKSYLQTHWQQTKAALLRGDYRPQAVLKVSIPKAGDGQRELGIPTVLDRLIQQAIHQVLSPIFEEHFSNSSYGFRPNRSAGQAVQQAREYMEAGHRWVVDIDLEKFFDKVNHDILMSRIARHVKDKAVLKLIRAYLVAGISDNGQVNMRTLGTPQGGPLSPLLSNIILTDLDNELEHRGHKFCRYADDCNIYVKSERAGQRVLQSVTTFLENTLKLKVNQEKSDVGRPWQRKFLGYSVCNRKQNIRLRMAPAVQMRFKKDVKQMLRSARGWSLHRTVEKLNLKLRGWMTYFRHINVKQVLLDLDGWLRRHLRKILWRQWKRIHTRIKRLIALGIDASRAATSAVNGRGPWFNSGASHMNHALPKKHFDYLGLISLMDYYHRLKNFT